MIDLNVTLWIQLINFLVTLVVLNYLLIRPVRDIIRKRKDTLHDLGQSVDAFTQKAEDALARYELSLGHAREEAAKVRKAAKAEAEALEHDLLAVATKDAQACLQSAQATVRAEAQKAKAALQAGIPAFAKAAVDKFLD